MSLFSLWWCRALTALTAVGVFATTAQAAPGMPRSADRELQQLQRDFDRARIRDEMQTMRERGAEAAPETPRPGAQAPKGDFAFFLSEVRHTPSEVLSKEEIRRAVAPWVGRTVTSAELSRLLEAVNALYRQKGYAVCQAVLKPQRIREGVLEITLIEGKTDEVTVSGARSTSSRYVLSAFDLEPGKVARHADLVRDLVEFNMTNDVYLTVDIRPGTKPGTSSYAIGVVEPDVWTGSVFADTTGSESTGRPRAGASITNRSLFGRRDAFTLFGLVSEGSRSAMASYALPLTAKGTRLTASASVSSVDVVGGSSAGMDVSGSSWLVSGRLDHPVYVDSHNKATLYAEVSSQHAESDVFGSVRISDTDTRALTLGLELLHTTENSVVYLNTSLTDSDVADNVFADADRDYRRWRGSIYANRRLGEKWRVSLAGAWQAFVSGDEMLSSDYFFLGHSSGVRGYDNDIVSAQNGFSLSAEAGYSPLGPKTEIFAFFDCGRLSGLNPYELDWIASTGLGLKWPLFDGASMVVTGSVPLKTDIGPAGEVNSARADISVSWQW